MSAPLVALFVLQALVFLAFVFLAFRWLFALRAIAVAKSGRSMPGLGATLAAFRQGLTDKQFAKLRWGIVICVFAVLILAGLIPFLLPVQR